MDGTKQLVLTVLLAMFLIAVGTAGYMVIEGWTLMDALYMTGITLTTVGYGEVRPMSQPGRVFTLVLIFLGGGFFFYVVGNVIQFLVEGRIRLVLGRRKLDKQISRLKDHYIVCGYGRMGRALCRFLAQKQLDVVVIEQNPDLVPVMDKDGILYVVGEASEESNLLKAGIDNARAFMTVLGKDAANVFLILIARRLNPGLFVVARANQNETINTLYAAGADKVVSPFGIGARRMAHAVIRPTVIHFLELAFADENTDIHMEEFPVAASSSLVDKTVLEAGVRQNLNLIILAMKKADGSMAFNPSATTRIEAGDTLIAVGEKRSLSQLEKLLNV
ncbi:MAG: potassium channel protein [Desulfobacteraceae bacterium]|nr:potassium channel protein [Desulfobacteraceae bacterium]